MATISSNTILGRPGAADTSLRHMDNSTLGFTLWREIDLAVAATVKGSALAAADVIEALRIPANHQVMAVAVRKTSAFTGSSTDLTLDVGVTGVDADIYVDGWDYDAAAVGSYGTPAGVQTPALIMSSADTIDILIATQTGTVTGGKILVSAFVRDLSVRQRGALAQPKS